MVASSYFIANDYDLAFNLQKHFHEYVALYTKLHYPESKNTVSHKERCEIILRLQEAVKEIALLGMKMKQFKTETETGIAKSPIRNAPSDPQPHYN
jgi:hypothetical protein